MIDSSEEELLEHAAFSLNPVSELSKWRRHHPDLAKHKYALTTGPRRRQRANHAPTCLPASGDMGSFGDLDEAEWEIFIEGVTGHLDAALQAGIWKAAHHKGSTAARNLFGSSAPC